MEYKDLFAPVYYEAWNDFLTQKVTEQWFAGGRGSGKSSFASDEIVTGLFMDPNANAIVFRKHQTDIKDSVYNQIIWAINQLGLASHFDFYLSPARIVLKATKQTIYFYGLDDPRKRKSIKPTRGYFRFMWLEELDQFEGMEEIRSIRQSVFRGGPVYQSIYTYNPPMSAANWVNAEAVRPAPGKKLYRSDYRDIARHNKAWISEAFILEAERTRKENETIWRHEYLGEATGTGAEVFSNVVAKKLDEVELRSSDKCQFSYGLDFGFTNDPSVIQFVAYDAAKRDIYLYKEWVRRGPFAEDIIEAVRATGIEDKTIIADRAADLAIKEMIRAGCNVRPCWKSPNGWRDEGYRWMRTRAHIYIDPETCPNAFKEFSHMEFGRYPNGDLRTEYPDGNDHNVDATRYGCEPWILKDMRPNANAMPVGIKRRSAY